MLTVDYDQLDLRAGHTLLDLGCGFGRHAFEALRRGADVVACDMAMTELATVTSMYDVMTDDGELAPGTLATAAAGDATRLPFADDTFDRVVASEVLEHIPDDRAALRELTRVLKPGGTIAVTVPAWLPEKLCWRLSDEYYAPKSPGGHLRIYRKGDVVDLLRDADLEPVGSHRAHALHSPYWWLRCAVGPTNDEHPLVRAYHRFLTWDIVDRPLVTRLADRALNPVLGKSLVLYAEKPVGATERSWEDHRAAA